MITKKARFWLTMILAVLLACSVWGAVSAFAAEGVDSAAPFYSNPFNPGTSGVVKNEDGSFTVSQTTGGGAARLFYGDYTSGGAENPYCMDLRDATIRFSVNELPAGNSIQLYFVSFAANGDAYPLQGYGQGFEVLMTDDGGASYGHAANSGYTPVLHTFSRDNSFAEKRYSGSNWFIYNNDGVRPSSIGKEIVARITADESNLTVELTWTPDGNNPSALNYTAQIPLNELPTEGGIPFDYKNAYFGITNSAGERVSLTISEISDAINDAYYDRLGGKYKNSVAYTKRYMEAVQAFSVDATTAQQVKDFYAAKLNFDGLNPNGLRKNDAYEYGVAVAMNVEGFAEAAFDLRDEVFAGYDESSEIADREDAIAVFAFYAEFADELEEYAAIAEHIRSSLAQDDLGQRVVENAIADLTDTYSSENCKRENYRPALAAYNAVTEQYNALSAFVRALVGNYADLKTWSETSLLQMKELYYSVTGSYFSNEYGKELDEETQEEVIRKSFAGAVRAEDGSTKLILADDVALRLIYGENFGENGAVDYTVDISDFEMTFTIDSVADSGRFAINFASHRSALPYGKETNPGLTIMFRVGFGGVNTVGVALAETKGGGYPDKNAFPEFAGNNDWGGFGDLSNASGILGKKITLKLQKNETGVALTLAMEGGNTISVQLSAAFLDHLFVQEGTAIETSTLAMNFSVGEGMVSYSGGRDIELTVKNIRDGYAKSLTELKQAFATYENLLNTLSEKDDLAFNEIVNYNVEKSAVDGAIAALRHYEAAEYAEKTAALDGEKIQKIDSLAANYMKEAMQAIGKVTVETVSEAEAKINDLSRQWAKFSAEQRALYPEFEESVATVLADVAGYRAAGTLIDEIAALVAKNPLPATIDALRAEYAAILAQFEALAEEYRNAVSNREEFAAYGAKLESYDPAKSVSDAIEKLFTDYETITGSNRNEAKTAVQNVKDAYDELTDSQKAEVENYAKIAQFEEKIAAFEQSLIDFAKASALDKKILEIVERFTAITAENREEAVTAAADLTAEYEALTQTQKEMVEQFAAVQTLREKIDAYDASVIAENEAKKAAEDVIAKINAIGTVENTEQSKTKIEEARAAYNALNAAAKSKVTNLSVLEKAEADYASLQEAAQKKGCGGSVYAAGALFSAIALASAVFALNLRKKD